MFVCSSFGCVGVRVCLPKFKLIMLYLGLVFIHIPILPLFEVFKYLHVLVVVLAFQIAFLICAESFFFRLRLKFEMDNSFDSLSFVSPGREGRRLKVRVLRLWEVPSFLNLE